MYVIVDLDHAATSYPWPCYTYATAILNRTKHSVACNDVSINNTSKTWSREKEKDLTQSFDKSPFNNRKLQEQNDNTKTN